MLRLKPADEITRARRGALGQREQQLPLGAEPLRQRPGRHARLGGDLRERELAGPEAQHGAIGRREDLLVAHFSRAWTHGLDVSI